MLSKAIFVSCVVASFFTTEALPQKEKGFNYCNNTQTRCGDDSKHIGCKSPFWKGGWGETCQEPSFVTLSDSVEQQIVDIHNKNRNQQALGKVSSHYKPAKLMGTMGWDQKLGDLAELNGRNCTFEHDQCHNTKTWWLSGQNIFISYSSNAYTDATTEQTILDMTDAWFSDEWPNGKYYNWMDAIYNNYTSKPSQNDHMIGHWTAIVQDISQAVGCAAVKFRSPNGDSDPWYSLYLVCNYAFTNLVGRSAYVPGKAASGCETKNSDYPGLCAIGQKFYLDENTPYP